MPIGISRFHNTVSLGGGPEPIGTKNYQMSPGVQALVVNADLGISFTIPICLLPGDIHIGNIITITMQRNTI